MGYDKMKNIKGGQKYVTVYGDNSRTNCSKQSKTVDLDYAKKIKDELKNKLGNK